MWILWIVTAAFAQPFGVVQCDTAEACFEHGVQRVVDSGDPKEGAAYFSFACDGGHVAACVNLASLYERGQGVPEDRARAAELYRQGCEADLQLACVGLGRLMANGEGVPQDDAGALKLFEQACTAGQGSGCTAWGQMLEGGFGAEVDVAEAFARYRLGCEGGDPDGCITLADRRAATGRPDALAEALGLWKKACEMGEGSGCAKAGSHLWSSSVKGTVRREARALLDQACALGELQACR